MSVSVVRECVTSAGKERKYEEEGAIKTGKDMIGTRRSFSSRVAGLKGVLLLNVEHEAMMRTRDKKNLKEKIGKKKINKGT